MVEDCTLNLILFKDHGASSIICNRYVTSRLDLRFDKTPELSTGWVINKDLISNMLDLLDLVVRDQVLEGVLGLGELIGEGGDGVLVNLASMTLTENI